MIQKIYSPLLVISNFCSYPRLSLSSMALGWLVSLLVGRLGCLLVNYVGQEVPMFKNPIFCLDSSFSEHILSFSKRIKKDSQLDWLIIGQERVKEKVFKGFSFHLAISKKALRHLFSQTQRLMPILIYQVW